MPATRKMKLAKTKVTGPILFGTAYVRTAVVNQAQTACTPIRRKRTTTPPAQGSTSPLHRLNHAWEMFRTLLDAPRGELANGALVIVCRRVRAGWSGNQ